MANETPAALDTRLETLEGELERVVYANAETGWTVASLKADSGRPRSVPVVGLLLGVKPGERLELLGQWVEDPKYGRQFRVETCRRAVPTTTRGIERYLASGLVPGIGPELAKRMVEVFGADTLTVIENHPEKLRKVPGIGGKRSASIREAFLAQRDLQDLLVFLSSHEVPTHVGLKVYRRYGGAALGMIQRDPFRLAREVIGIGFATADAIASRLGVPKTAPERIEAGLLHLLEEGSTAGHVYLPEPDLGSAALELLGVEPQLPIDALARLAESADVVIEPTAEGPRAVFLKRLFHAEADLSRRLARLLSVPAAPLAIDPERALAWFEEREGITLAPDQREAIRRACREKVLVITGGPGTGKTTLVRGIVEILRRKDRRILLAAPTGRAAKRLAEATRFPAVTIHRLLEFDPTHGGFTRGADHPLEADLVIVDESSMLDLPLAASLAAAVPAHAQLVLVGDVDQLPSVGPGSVLADLIDSQVVTVVRLQHIYRQGRDAGLIVANAHRVNRGEMPEWSTEPGEQRDFFVIERRDPAEILRTLVQVVSKRIPESFGLDAVEDVQVLSPMNRGSLGVDALNEALRAALNPTGVTLRRGATSLRVGDKVMQIRNNYDLEVFNGDIGRVVALDEEAEELECSFDGRRVSYPFANLDELTLAYACSIHKSQGSEYPAVVVPLHKQHYLMLERNLLYTALTRAKRLVVLLGDPQALHMAVRNRRTRFRHTALAERLRRAVLG